MTTTLSLGDEEQVLVEEEEFVAFISMVDFLSDMDTQAEEIISVILAEE